MKPSDKPKFANLITDVMGYYGKDATDFTLQVWWNACQNFDFEQVSKALSAHAADPEHGQFAPKVADLVRILQGTQTDRALLAWGKVMEAISGVGAYQDVVFDDPAIHAAVNDCGGWIKICRGDLAEISYLQHRFCQSHKAYTARGEFDYPRVLTGDRSPDSEYLKRGLTPPKPALVGNTELAKQVYLQGATGNTRISFQKLDVLALSAAKVAA